MAHDRGGSCRCPRATVLGPTPASRATGLRAAAIAARHRAERRSDTSTACAVQTPAQERERPEAPAQSAPPVGGREDGTSKGSVRDRDYGAGVQTQAPNRLRNFNATIGSRTDARRAGRIAGHAVQPPRPRRSSPPPRSSSPPAARRPSAPPASPAATAGLPRARASRPAQRASPRRVATRPAGSDLRADPRRRSRRSAASSRPKAVEPVTIDEAELLDEPRGGDRRRGDPRGRWLLLARISSSTLGLIPEGSSIARR